MFKSCAKDDKFCAGCGKAGKKDDKTNFVACQNYGCEGKTAGQVGFQLNSVRKCRPVENTSFCISKNEFWHGDILADSDSRVGKS